jgi:hypothetical protein
VDYDRAKRKNEHITYVLFDSQWLVTKLSKTICALDWVISDSIGRSLTSWRAAKDAIL